MHRASRSIAWFLSHWPLLRVCNYWGCFCKAAATFTNPLWACVPGVQPAGWISMQIVPGRGEWRASRRGGVDDVWRQVAEGRHVRGRWRPRTPLSCTQPFTILHFLVSLFIEIDFATLGKKKVLWYACTEVSGHSQNSSRPYRIQKT